MSDDEEITGAPNSQQDDGQHGEQYKRESVLMGIRITVFIIGVIGNCAVVFVILTLREYKKAITHWYVLQLAIADTLFLITLPFKVSEDAYDEWQFSGAMCKIKEALLFLNYYSSVLFLMVMSIDRYVALCHGFSNVLHKLRTNRSAYIITVIVWIVSLVLCAPIMSTSDKRGMEPTCKCQYDFAKEAITHNKTCKDLEKNSGGNLDKCIKYLESQGNCLEKNFFFHLMEIMDYSENDTSGFQYNTTAYIEDAEYYSGDDNIGTIYDETTYLSSEDTVSNDSSTGPVYELGCSYSASSSAWTAFILFNFIVMFLIPSIVMSICYSLIACRLRNSRFIPGLVATTESKTSGRRNSENPGRKRKLSAASVRAERNRMRVTFVCLILVVLFLVCWLPFHAVHLAKLQGIHGSSEKCAWMASVTAIVAYLNSALNPYIYNCIGTHFGRRFRSAAGSVRMSVRQRTHSVSSSGGIVRYPTKKISSTGTSNVSVVLKQ